jgi:hypothetical protein
MVPELARLLAGYDRAGTIVSAQKVAANQPAWYAAFGPAALGTEHNLNYPVDAYQVFLAKAWLSGESPAQLASDVDIPWLGAGDLFYMHKLAEIIKAYHRVTWTPGGPSHTES